MYGKVPLNMQMIEEVRLKCDRASGQFQSSELTSRHFNKNAVDRGDDSLCNSRQWNHAQPEQQKHVSSSLGNRSIAGSYRYSSWQL